MTTSPTVLVADDDHDIRTLVVTKLERAGYRVLPAADGAEALELIRAEHPALALLDIMMPRMDGLEVAAAIREDATLRGTKVLLLTAKARDVDVDAGFQAGADEYVIKPFSPRELVERVRRLLPED